MASDPDWISDQSVRPSLLYGRLTFRQKRRLSMKLLSFLGRKQKPYAQPATLAALAQPAPARGFFARKEMSLFDRIMPAAIEVEQLLTALGYQGRGIHEQLTASGNDLDIHLVRAARKIATIRNKVAHTKGFMLTGSEVASFEESKDFVLFELRTILVRRYELQKRAS
ncbi:hypothetical protein [Paraburkholderia youngii]|uniref:hypothetical protein n=1 Tax=Paraburkholderia youngii TaxID=2782701 RepID=UPI003D243D60